MIILKMQYVLTLIILKNKLKIKIKKLIVVNREVNMDVDKINGLLNRDCIVNSVSYLESVGSTNDEVKKLGCQNALVAKIQTNGRGRNGRVWQSDGDNLYMSMMISHEGDVHNISAISLVVGVSVMEVMHSINVNCGLKWPNDILYNNKKLGGILLEACFLENRLEHIVVGIGVNVNGMEYGEFNDIATSVRKISGKEYDVSDIVVSIINAFDKNYKLFIESGFEPFREMYQKNCVHINKDIKISNGEEITVVKCIGIANDGQLVVKYNNDIKYLQYGEISINING